MATAPARPEFWTSARSLPGRSRPTAMRLESEGWDGLTFTDSQNLSGDPYVALATAAAATERIRLATGVTNPWTRHAAVTAGAITCVNVESGGRAELGIGRGDSALAYLGLAPVSPEVFEDYVKRVQRYLAGKAVGFAQKTVPPAEAALRGDGRAVRDTVTVADAPRESRLEWLSEVELPGKVPVFAVASGPKMIALAARVADRVSLALGADQERVRWGVEAARKVRPDVPVGAYVQVVPHENLEEATQYAAGGIASFARFSAMHGTTAAPAEARDRDVMESVAKAYQLTKHFTGAGSQAAVVTPAFAQRFAIIGPPEECVHRIRELTALGIDRFDVSIASRDAPLDIARRLHQRFVTEVLPAFR